MYDVVEGPSTNSITGVASTCQALPFAPALGRPATSIGRRHVVPTCGKLYRSVLDRFRPDVASLAMSGMERLPAPHSEPLQRGEWVPMPEHERYDFSLEQLRPCPARIGRVLIGTDEMGGSTLAADPRPRVQAAPGLAGCTSCPFVMPVYRTLDGDIGLGYPPLLGDF